MTHQSDPFVALLTLAAIVLAIASASLHRAVKKLRLELAQMQTRLDRLEREEPAQEAPSSPRPAPETAPSPTPEPPGAARAQAIDRAYDQLRATVAAREADTPPADEAPPSTPPADEAPMSAPPSFPRRIGAFERLADNWLIWVGAAALAAAGAFLVAYSIEQGLLGPEARIAAALILGAALIGGAWRVNRGAEPAWRDGRGPTRAAGGLAAAGISILLAAIYGAFALYGLIPAVIAFAGLATVSLAAFVLSYYFGRILAGVGLLGAYATPILAGGGEPQPVALALYLAAVAASAAFTARYARWAWLVAGAVGLSFAWIVLMAIQDPASIAYTLFALAIAAAPWTLRPDARAAPRALWMVAVGAPAGAFLLAMANEFLGFAPGTALAGVLIPLAAGLYATDRRPAAIGAAFFAGLTILAQADVRDSEAALWAVTLTLVAATGIGGFAAGVLRPPSRVPMRIAAFVPVALVAIGFGVSVEGETSLRWGLAAFAVATLQGEFIRSSIANRRPKALADFTVAFAAALTLGLATVLRGQGLAVALAAFAAAAAFAQTRLPLRHAGWIAGLAATAASAIILMDPFGPLEAVPAWRIAVASTLAAALCWAGARAFQGPAKLRSLRQQRETGEQWLAGAASLIAAGGFALTVRSLWQDGDLSREALSLAESTTYTLAWIGGAAGGFAARNLAGPVATARRWILLVLAGAQLVFVQLLTSNPVLDGPNELGELIVFNLLGFGYLLPGLGLATVALFMTRRNLQKAARYVGVIAGLLIFLYLNFELRRTIHGVVDYGAPLAPGELAGMTMLWTTAAIGLVLLGHAARLRSARLAGLALAALVAIKAGLFDTAGLNGLWRTLSFLALGLGLIGLGALDRRLLSRGEAEEPPRPSPTP